MKVLVVDYSHIREGAIRDARMERDDYNRNRLDRVVEGGDDRVVIGYRDGDCWPLRSNMSYDEALDVLRRGR